MVDLRSLEVFYWVVKLGGFGRAAERLAMTQPAVSARILQLEQRFATRLLDRAANRPATATPKGLELLAYAERILALTQEMDTRFGSAELAGIARIGVSETLVHTLLGAMLGRLHRAQPAITPEVTVDLSPVLHAMLLGGELDVALLLGPINEPRIRNLDLAEYQLVWVASPALNLPEGRLDLATVATWPILSYARGTAPHASLSALFARPDLPPARIFGSSSLASIVRMAVDAIGVGVVPAAVVAEDIRDGRLLALDVNAALPALRFTISYVAGPGDRVAAAVAAAAAPP
jgi:DNA-binding transcriptional LysR family regulator